MQPPVKGDEIPYSKMSPAGLTDFADRVRLTTTEAMLEPNECGGFKCFRNSTDGDEKLTDAGKDSCGSLQHLFGDLFFLHVANLKKMDFAEKECLTHEYKKNEKKERLLSYQVPGEYPKWAFLLLNVMCCLPYGTAHANDTELADILSDLVTSSFTEMGTIIPVMLFGLSDDHDVSTNAWVLQWRVSVWVGRFSHFF